MIAFSKKISIIYLILICCSSCGTFFNQPLQTSPARLGEITEQTSELSNLPEPTDFIIASVYKFRDQTGQYKLSEVGSSFSTAVTQGATSILLKAMEDSGWFITIERENQNNLLTERQLIRSSQQQYMAENPDVNIRTLPALYYADILLEGGIISYDSNIITGGYGLRYFGAGGSTQYREDRISVYLRAVDTKTGEIIKTVYVSKTILSQALNGGLFRYVKFRRLLEAEAGITYNEPTHLAITEAIEMALVSLLVEGLADGLWSAKISEEEKQALIDKYTEEKSIAESTHLFSRFMTDQRGKFGVGLNPSVNQLDGDYSNANYRFGGSGEFDFFVNPKFAISPKFSVGELSVNNISDLQYRQGDLLLKYVMLPFENFSPIAEIGPSYFNDSNSNESYFGGRYSLGLEYLPSPTIGISANGGQTFYLSDEIDGVVNGRRDDYLTNFSMGLHLYFGKNKSQQPVNFTQNDIEQQIEIQSE